MLSWLVNFVVQSGMKIVSLYIDKHNILCDLVQDPALLEFAWELLEKNNAMTAEELAEVLPSAPKHRHGQAVVLYNIFFMNYICQLLYIILIKIKSGVKLDRVLSFSGELFKAKFETKTQGDLLLSME